MGRVIQLKNGETISTGECDKYSILSSLIYEFLGADCYRLFIDYDQELTNEIFELREDRDWWMACCDED